MKKITNYSIIIDTTGLRCPLPVLKVRKNLPDLKKNDFALIIADDPLAEIDLAHFCSLKNYNLKKLPQTQDNQKQYYEITF